MSGMWGRSVECWIELWVECGMEEKELLERETDH